MRGELIGPTSMHLISGPQHRSFGKSVSQPQLGHFQRSMAFTMHTMNWNQNAVLYISRFLFELENGCVDIGK